MTFNDIANQACAIVGETDPVTLAFAQDRSKDSYRVIWNSFAWPETKRSFTITMPANQAYLFTPFNFGEIISAAWRPNLSLEPIVSAYRELGWIRENQPGVSRPGINAINPSYYWKGPSMGVPLDPINAISFHVIAAGGDNVTFNIHGLATEPTTGLTFETSEALIVSASGPGSYSPVNNFTSILSLNKTAGSSIIVVYLNNSSTPSFVMQPLDGKYEFNQYLFLPVPTSTWYWDLELKLRAPEFTTLQNSDTPAIQHLEDAIMLYVQSELLKRQRQYNKSNTVLQQAEIFIQGAKDLFRNQEDFFDQIVPDVYDVTNLHGWRTRRRTSSFF